MTPDDRERWAVDVVASTDRRHINLFVKVNHYVTMDTHILRALCVEQKKSCIVL
jgi:hypothetical protein